MVTSRWSDPPQLPNYNSRINLTTRSTSQDQPVTSATCVGCHQRGSDNINQFNANTTVAGRELEDSYYEEIDPVSEPVQDESSSSEAPKLPDISSRPDLQSTLVAQQPIVTSSVNGRDWNLGSDSSNSDATDISTTCLQHTQPTSALRRIVGTNRTIILALAVVILLTTVVTGMSVTIYKHRSATANDTTLLAIGQNFSTPATFTNSSATYPSNLIEYDGIYTYVGDNVRKRKDVGKNNEQTVILNTGFPPTSGQRVVGVRVFASKPSSRTLVNFGIYRHVPPDACRYTLNKSYPLNITAVDKVFDIMFEPSQQHTVTPGDTFGIWWSIKSGGSIYYDMEVIEEDLSSNDNYCFSKSKIDVGVQHLFLRPIKTRKFRYSVQAILV